MTPQPSLELTQLANRLRERGERVINIGPGQPDFAPPPEAQRALADSAYKPSDATYCPTEGVPELRERIADRVNERIGVEAYTRDNVIVTNGSQMALNIATHLALPIGGSMLAPDPYFPPYRQLASLREAEFHTYGTRLPGISDEGVGGTLADVDAQLVAANSPSNPTGYVLNEDEVGAIASYAMSTGAWVVSDEVYDEFLYANAAKPPQLAEIEHLRERLLIVNSFSKTYGMAGWRLGYLVAPTESVPELRRLHQYSGRAASRPIQAAGCAALDADPGWVAANVELYESRRDLVVERLKKIPGVQVLEPEGGFYVCIDIRAITSDDVGFAYSLLKDRHVQVGPGSQYGEAMSGWLRLSIGTDADRLLEGIETLEDMMSRVEPT